MTNCEICKRYSHLKKEQLYKIKDEVLCNHHALNHFGYELNSMYEPIYYLHRLDMDIIAFNEVYDFLKPFEIEVD